MQIRIDNELREGINNTVHDTDKDPFRAYSVIGGQFDETFTTLAENEVASLRLTNNRAAHTNLRNSSGNEIGTATNPVRNDPTGTTDQPISASTLPLPNGASTELTLAAAVTVLNNLLIELQLKADLTETQPVSSASLPLAAGASTSVLQTQPGVDIGDVTLNNTVGSGAANFKISDASGFVAQFSPNQQLQISEPYRLNGATFGSAIDTNFWTATTSGAGSASGVANSVATITSGTANSGFGKIRTARATRFLFAHPHKFRAAILLPTVAVADNTRRWGSVSLSTVTPQDGVFFSVSATGVLSVNWVSGGAAVNTISSGSFNGAVSSYALDTNVHDYEIIFSTMGIWFYVDDVLIHKVTPTTSILYKDLSLPINIWSTNSASGTTSGTVVCWNAATMRLGRSVTSPVSFFQQGTTAGVNLKLAPGTLRGLFVSGVVDTSVVTVYDNTTAAAPILWSSGTMGKNVNPFSLNFIELNFYTGLTLGITGAASNVLVIYE